MSYVCKSTCRIYNATQHKILTPVNNNITQYYSRSPKVFIHQWMHFLLILENSIIYIKTYIKIAAWYFYSWYKVLLVGH
jgi:hypothetical protein